MANKLSNPLPIPDVFIPLQNFFLLLFFLFHFDFLSIKPKLIFVVSDIIQCFTLAKSLVAISSLKHTCNLKKYSIWLYVSNNVKQI